METGTVAPEAALPGAKSSTSQPASRLLRLALVLAGILLGQFVLYGPSLVGSRILLPLDILAQEQVYLPRTAEVKAIEAQDPNLTDLVYLMEPARRFAVSELHSGRLPMWAPHEYGGVPYIAPKFSPILLLECLSESPVVLAWAQLAAALIAGLGAYAFFRQALGVSFWPAAICSWCYPLTGFFIFWQGFTTGLPVYWLPWLLLVVNRLVRQTSLWDFPNLAIVTCLVLISGHLDVAAQVLLASGLYALWCLYDAYTNGAVSSPRFVCARAVARLSAGWALGFLLAAPYLLPVLEYTQTGSRLARRSAGEQERPPIGWAALPETVLPDTYGAMHTGSLRYVPDHQAESSAATYVGLFATLIAAPLAFCNRHQRRLKIFWLCLSIFSLGWCINLPGLVQVLRLPGLNMLSHNRLVFVASFALLALATLGLDALRQSPVGWRGWMWLPVATLAGLSIACIYRSMHLPEPLATQLAELVRRGGEMRWVHDLQGVARAQASFIRYHTIAAIACGLGAVLWWLLRKPVLWQTKALPWLGLLFVGDLLYFGYGRNPQCAPALYFPPVPVLQDVAKSAPGRVMGFGCFPANLAVICNLRDIRGYDGVDPAHMTELLLAAADPNSPKPTYAQTLQLAPKGNIDESGNIKLLPVLDMLGVRYIILRGSPPPNARPLFQGPDYWVLANPSALPRVFVPHRTELTTDDHARLAKVASPQFDPREVAFLEQPADLPPACRGSAEILEEIPTRIRVSLDMETAGLVVLADRWDKGWKAYLDGKPAEILRTNHALRGVLAPSGARVLEFRYDPASFKWGVVLTLAATAILVLQILVSIWLQRNRHTS